MTMKSIGGKTKQVISLLLLLMKILIEVLSWRRTCTGWSIIWRIKVPSRIQAFTWLVRHERILGNDERKRRHLTQDNLCPVCHQGAETTEHIVRSCEHAKRIWNSLSRNGGDRRWETLNFRDWIDANLNGKWFGQGECNWPATFMISVWWLWRWRNDTVFNGVTHEHRNKVDWLKKQCENIHEAFAKAKEPGLNSWNIHNLSWEKPGEDITVLNVDASVDGISGRAGCAGVLRDRYGGWKGGFTCSLDNTNVIYSEGWAVAKGLKWAWDKGVRRLEVRTDSREIARWINGRDAPRGPLREIIEECRKWMNQQWEVAIHHTYREQNRVADTMAKDASRSRDRWRDHTNPRPYWNDALFDDLVGLPFTRLINGHT